MVKNHRFAAPSCEASLCQPHLASVKSWVNLWTERRVASCPQGAGFSTSHQSPVTRHRIFQQSPVTSPSRQKLRRQRRPARRRYFLDPQKSCAYAGHGSSFACGRGRRIEIRVFRVNIGDGSLQPDVDRRRRAAEDRLPPYGVRLIGQPRGFGNRKLRPGGAVGGKRFGVKTESYVAGK